MSQVYAFLLDLVRHARANEIDLPKVGAYDDVRLHAMHIPHNFIIVCFD